GKRWRELRTQGPAELQAFVAAARGGIPHPALDGATSSASLDEARAILAKARNVLAEGAEHTDGLPAAFELGVEDVSFDRALELARLASLANSADRPESGWLTPDGTRRAQETIHQLRSLLGQVAARGEMPKLMFTHDVLTLDLEMLCVRFESR